ncbi:MAG: RagB/SusD family nutrient uptake outer membrane protein [Bacteroidales bacterium]|nr:RagB/SusD family nutrient uptake outer membrane protein [Bacteroidales bacterium]MCL2132973.1 RagB/SusD family nutrient uptake outer membrane protein [Bacteroidales bacterium]
MKTIYKLFAVSILTLFSLNSCNEFLDVVPNDFVTLENFFQSNEDLMAATAPLYNKVWFDFNDKFFYGLGEGRSNNLFAPYSDYIYPFTTLTESSLTGPLVSAWQSFYNVVGQANNTLNNIKEKATGVTEEQKNAAIAEARFMRGTAYWYLASLWEDVIIIEDNRILVANPIVPTNPRLDVFEFAIRDLEFAAKHLPQTSSAIGRLNKYSAYAMLSRIYLSRAGLSGNDRNSGQRDPEYLELARKAAEKVCKESNFVLMQHYGDLFRVENNNNSESIFALQWLPGFSSETGYGIINTQQAYFAASSDITGDDAAWGSWTFASYDIMRTYEITDDIRRYATFMARGDHYPELNSANGGYTQDNTDRCYIKKGVTGGPKDTDGKSARMNSALNTYMMRLAEVYLIYAEAVLGNNTSTNDAEALYYFNEVRKRSGMYEKNSISYNDIHYERRIELAMEGQYWYDLVRRSYYRQEEVIGYMNNQDRAAQYLYDKDTHTTTIESQDARPVETATAAKLKLPYPESEVVQNPLLRQTPVPYVFTEPKITDLF